MRYFLIFALIIALTSCQKKIPGDCDQSPLYGHLPFNTGVAVDVNKLKDNQHYRDIVIRQFNSITPENAFKWSYTMPSRGMYNWEDADYLVAFAKQYNKRLHGHTLLWYRSDPAWLESLTAQEAEAVMKAHIDNMITRYKTVAQSWDVVNEAFDDEGNMRPTVWQKHMGDGYIRKAFEYARAADPNALLFYNDYSMEMKPMKLEAVLAHLKQLRKEGVKIDGVGLQLHIGVSYPSVRDIAQAAGRFIHEGFMVHFSEMDVRMNFISNKQSFSQTDLQRHARRYKEVFKAYNSFDPAKRFGITLWGVSDADSWIPGEFGKPDIPLLYDNNYNPKPAYCACKLAAE